MKVEMLSVGPMQTNCYIVYQDQCGILIDPGDEPNRILTKIRTLGLEVQHIVLTHAHYDHILALDEVMKALPQAKLCLGHREQEVLTDRYKNLIIYMDNHVFVPVKPDILLREGDRIPLGTGSLKVIETPGHTVGSICLLGDDILISGDTLFYRGMGRCDLPTGNLKAEVDSITNKLFLLKDHVTVYPGHGPQTTIGFEKANNEVSLYQ